MGGIIGGVAGELLGAPGAVVFGGIATMLIAVIWWRIFPALRDIDRFPASVAELDHATGDARTA